MAFPQYGSSNYNTSIGTGGIQGMPDYSNLPDFPQRTVEQQLHNLPGMLNRVTPEQMRELTDQNVDSYRMALGPQQIGAQRQTGAANLAQQFGQISAADNASNGYLNALNGIAGNMRGNEVNLTNAQGSLRNSTIGMAGGILGNIFGGRGLFGGF